MYLEAAIRDGTGSAVFAALYGERGHMVGRSGVRISPRLES